MTAGAYGFHSALPEQPFRELFRRVFRYNILILLIFIDSDWMPALGLKQSSGLKKTHGPNPPPAGDTLFIRRERKVPSKYLNKEPLRFDEGMLDPFYPESG